MSDGDGNYGARLPSAVWLRVSHGLMRNGGPRVEFANPLIRIKAH